MKSNKSVLAGLAAVVGMSAALILGEYIPAKEGVVKVGYLDAIGVPTKCMGDTRDVIVGKQYTDSECLISMESALISHAKPVLKCTPVLKEYPEALAASVSFAYNLGSFAYCNSEIAYNINKGNYETACKRFNENEQGQPQWIYADCKTKVVNGRSVRNCLVLKGLVIRRAEERAMCERGFKIRF